MDKKSIYDNLSTVVDMKLTTHEKITKLTSNASFNTIHTQIKYFNVFFINSIEENNSRVILNILPWMYHAFNSQGFQYDYFVLLYEIWEKSIIEIEDKEIQEIFQTRLNELKQNHPSLIDKSEHYTTNIEPIPEEFITIKEEFKDSLLHGDLEKSKEIFESSVQSYIDLQIFYKYIIYPSMSDVGIAWEKGLITPAHEHLATTIVLNILSKLYNKLPLPDIDKKKIMVGTTTNEYHEVGALMLTSALQLQGWDVEYFGTNVQEEDFLNEIKEKEPFIVALSISMPFNLNKTKNLVAKIKQIDEKIKIMVGGNAFQSETICTNRCGADVYLKDIDDAVNEAQLWLESENELS